MSDGYVPPFQVTEEITNLTIEIGQYAGFTTAFEELHPNPVLRRENRIRSIHSSLAIEQNTLTLNQVSDVIDGKRVFGPPQDIREVKNAYEVYDAVSSFDPYSVKDLLRAHQIMMEGLVREAGVFRSGNVGVYAGTQLIHAGTPAKYVPELMRQLFSWLKKSKYHSLIKSCVFHYDTMWNSTRRMAECIAGGLREADPSLTVKLFNSAVDDKNDIVTEVFKSKAILVGSPTINYGYLFSIGGIMEMIRGLKFRNKKAAAFGSYGWSGEAVKQITALLDGAGFEIVNDGLRCQWAPDEATQKLCRDYGREFASAVR